MSTASCSTTPVPPATGRRLGSPWRLPGVYRPQADTLLLAEALVREGVEPGARVLDVGTGSGALAVLAARMGARVEAMDVSRRAVVTAWINATRAGQHITLRRRHLRRTVSGGGRFDLVVCNPPYVPTPTHRAAPRALAARRRAARAWDAGVDGRDVIDLVCARAAGLLRPHGVLLMVHSGLCGAELTVEKLARAGLDAEVSARALVPHGPVVRSRLPWLRARGLVAPGERHEELVVIRAERV